VVVDEKTGSLNEPASPELRQAYWLLIICH